MDICKCELMRVNAKALVINVWIFVKFNVSS